MLESFLPTDGLDPSDIDVLYVLAAAFMPSIIVLLMVSFAQWLPDDGYVSSQSCGDQPLSQRQPSTISTQQVLALARGRNNVRRLPSGADNSPGPGSPKRRGRTKRATI
jgi:hypothetical protein